MWYDIPAGTFWRFVESIPHSMAAMMTDNTGATTYQADDPYFATTVNAIIVANNY